MAQRLLAGQAGFTQNSQGVFSMCRQALNIGRKQLVYIFISSRTGRDIQNPTDYYPYPIPDGI